MSTSSPFTTGTGDASAKRTDAKSAKRNNAMRAMVVRRTRNAGDLQGEVMLADGVRQEIGIKIWRWFYTRGKCSYTRHRAERLPEICREEGLDQKSGRQSGVGMSVDPRNPQMRTSEPYSH